MPADPTSDFRAALQRATDAAGSLPPPNDEERTHSEWLQQLIRREMENAGGSIGFDHFMQLALYAPGLGYYSAGKHKFGQEGDFITAPEMGPLFARCLAHQCAPILRQPDNADMLEAGAGSGVLAADLLLELETLDALPRHYYILELSPALRARQAQTLSQRAAHLAARVRWLDDLPRAGFRGVVLANELLDAMPVQRFVLDASGIQEQCVTWHDGAFAWHARAADTALIRHIEARMNVRALVPGYASEIGLQAEAWVRGMGELLECGLLLLIDYGFPRAEFYHPQRDGGTLMCHYRHRAHGNPLILPGLQDITAHIDFTAIAEAGTDAGLSLLGYTSQAAFLLASGITQFAEQGAENERARVLRAQEIKKLTLPQEMGELFKVMAFGRGPDITLTGFALQDRRGRL
jgi:SAM-dependent MidA family methyltransferase